MKRTLLTLWSVVAILGVALAVRPALLATAQVSPTSSTPGLSGTPARTSTPSEVPTRTPTRTPTRPPGLLYILSSASEMMFPAAVRLEVALSLDEKDIQAAKVRIYQPGNNALDFTATPDLKKGLLALKEKSLLLSYVWEFEPERPPEPFSTINFDWEVTTTSGVTETIRNKFVFEDEIRFDTEFKSWRSTDGTVKLYSHAERLALNILQTGAQRALNKLQAETGIRVEGGYRVVIYEPDANWCQRQSGTPTPGENSLFIASRVVGAIRVACDPRDVQKIYKAHRFLVLRRAGLTLDRVQDQIVEALAGDMLDRLWQGPEVPPAWFQAGLMQLYGLLPQPAALSLAREANRVDNLLPPGSLMATPVPGAATTRLWQAQSYLLVLYLASRFGAAVPFEIARNAAKSSFAEALRAATTHSFEELVEDWRAWLASDAAQAAVRWTPYQATTPTPSPVVTATLRPSNTPTWRVPTATYTRQPTVTSPPSRTPIPPTVTASPIPPTPTP